MHVTCLLLLQLRETLNQGPSWRDCVEVKHGYYKETPLLFATWNKKYDVVNVLLQFKVPTNSFMCQSITPLSFLIVFAHVAFALVNWRR